MENFNRIALVFVCSLISTCILSQEKHLEFRGIPLDGSLSSFEEKMDSIGYDIILIQDHAVVMEGEFIGKKANLFIFSSPITDNVWKVVVSFGKEISWSSLKYEYRKIKDLYTQKYGKSSHSFEFFTNPYYEGDGYELQALRNEKCTYVAYFELVEGTIAVRMNSEGSIGIVYEDGINVDKAKKERENNIMNEI